MSTTQFDPEATNQEPTQVTSRPAATAGVIGGLAAATCCIGPAIGVALGAASGSFLIAMGAYRPLLFVIGGLIALAIVVVMLKRRRASCPTDADYRELCSKWITATLVAFAITYAVGRFVVAGLIERL